MGEFNKYLGSYSFIKIIYLHLDQLSKLSRLPRIKIYNQKYGIITFKLAGYIIFKKTIIF